MNKTVVGSVVILVIASLIGLYMWSSHNRYSVTISSSGTAYEVDKKTGKSWLLVGTDKVAQKDIIEQVIPYKEAEKITGSARVGGNGYFSGKLYNGSNWTVTKIFFIVSVSETKNMEPNSLKWSRTFSEEMTINPFSTKSFSIPVIDDQGIKGFSWGIEKVVGY